jgi:four-step phytoene desaturase (EC 1.3.99.-)
VIFYEYRLFLITYRHFWIVSRFIALTLLVLYMNTVSDLSDVDGSSVVVIGGGFGGLSTACYLSDAGADVTVLEKTSNLGGVQVDLKLMGSNSIWVHRGI